MLKGIPPILGPDLLFILRSMGHGDEIAIVDANYPAANAGPELVRMDGQSATDVLDAILTLVPLDATHKAVISLDQCRTLRASGKPAAEAAAIFVEKRIDGYRSYQRLGDPDAAPIHDALCVAALIEPDIIETRDYHVAVETAGTLTVGRTVIDTSFRSLREPNAHVAMNADTARFGRFVLETLIDN